MSGPLVLVGRHLRELPVLGGELGCRRDLDDVDVAERPLGEGGELPHRLDLDVEEVDADRAVGGGREEVEQLAADGELAAVLDLVDALVAHRGERVRRLVEVEQVALADDGAVRAQRRVRDLLAQRDRGDDDDRRLVGAALAVEQRVQRRDAQADEVRRRCEVGLVGDAAARVQADRPRVQPRAQVVRQLARLAVVAGHHERRLRVGVGERGDDVRPQRLGHERTPAVPLETGRAGVFVEVGEEGAEGHGAHAERPRTGRGGSASEDSAAA